MQQLRVAFRRLVAGVGIGAAFLAATRDVHAQTYVFSHHAGTLGGGGSADGTGSAARFQSPYGIAVDAAGTLYVADSANHTIRRVTASGVVTTLAGLVGAVGSADGTANAARFYQPQGIAMDAAGTLFVADTFSSTIRRVTASGVVTTVAGLAGALGSEDGTGSAARFQYPSGLAVDAAGTLYVADTGNSRRTINVQLEDPRLAGTAVSTRLTSATTFLAERSMWWPHGQAWIEAHNAAGATTTGTRWAVGDGEVGLLPEDTATYVLIANTSAFEGTLRVTLLFESGPSVSQDFRVPANSRFNVPIVTSEAPVSPTYMRVPRGTRFSTVIESLGDTPAQIVVERAMELERQRPVLGRGLGPGRDPTAVVQLSVGFATMPSTPRSAMEPHLSNPPGPRWPAIAALPIALAITLAVYARGLHAPFAFDDVVFADSSIVHVTSLQELRALIAMSGVPRKLTMVTFALNFWVDGLRPLGYHLVNASLHAVAAWLLFLLMQRLLSRAADDWWRAHATGISTLGVLVWMLHPVQTQAVVYTWQRATTLCVVCYLGALICYVEGRTRARGRWRWWFAGAVLAAAALAAKEIAATLPAAIWLIERQFLSLRRRSPPWLLLAAAAALVAIALDYLGPRFISMIDADFARRGFTPLERLLTESRVVMRYISLLAFPHPARLMVDYDVPLSRSLWAPPSTALAVSAIVVLLGLAAWWWRRVPLASVAVLWFLGHLVIESTIIPLDLAYEHRLYLPSTVPLVLGAGLLWRAFGTTWAGKTAIGLLCGLLAVWSAVRVEAWRDPVRLWADNAAKTPLKARVQGQLGKACLEAAQRDCAWRAFARAAALDPSRVDAENGLASVLINLDGDLPRAEEQLRTLLAREPGYVPALVNLGVVQLRTNRPAAAFSTLLRALKAEPSDRLVLLNLASAALAIGRSDAAFAAADRGVRVWPRHAAFYALRGLAGLESGRVADAQRDAGSAETLDPTEPLNAVLRDRLRKRSSPGGAPSR